MQDIPQETHHETTRLTQSARGALGNRSDSGRWRTLFFCNEQNDKGEPVTGRGDSIRRIPFRGRDLN